MRCWCTGLAEYIWTFPVDTSSPLGVAFDSTAFTVSLVDFTWVTTRIWMYVYICTVTGLCLFTIMSCERLVISTVSTWILSQFTHYDATRKVNSESSHSVYIPSRNIVFIYIHENTQECIIKLFRLRSPGEDSNMYWWNEYRTSVFGAAGFGFSTSLLSSLLGSESPITGRSWGLKAKIL